MGFLAFLVFLLGLVCSVVMNLSLDKEGGVDFKFKPEPILLFLLTLAMTWGLMSFVVVQAGDRGVVFNVFNGVQTKTLGAGTHFIPATINKVSHYDVYTKTFSDIIPCLSSDGLSMTMDVSIRYRINANKVAEIKSNVGEEDDILNKILIPTARSKMRDVTAQFSAQEAYASKRMQLQEKYRVILEEFFKGEDYIVAEQILVRQVTPPEALTLKITETKVAEQDVIKQKNVLEAEKQVKEQTIVKAQAEAESLRIKANAVAQNAKVIQLEWINKWDGHLPVYMLGNNTSLLMNMNNDK